MSAQPMPQMPMYPQMIAAPRSNGLGVASFVIGLLGLMTGGLLSPIALLLGLIALGRAPRGFAVFGLLLGFIGSLVWVAAALGIVLAVGVIGAAIVTVMGGMLMLFQPEPIELTGDMVRTVMAIQQYESEHNAAPTSIDDLDLNMATRLDPWGHAYALVEAPNNDPPFDIVSAGEDGEFDTSDDIRLTTLDRTWEMAMESFGRQMEDFERQGGFAQWQGDDCGWMNCNGRNVVIRTHGVEHDVAHEYAAAEAELARLRALVAELEANQQTEPNAVIELDGDGETVADNR